MNLKDSNLAIAENSKSPYRSPRLVVYGHFTAVTLGGRNLVNGDGGGRATKT